MSSEGGLSLAVQVIELDALEREGVQIGPYEPGSGALSIEAVSYSSTPEALGLHPGPLAAPPAPLDPRRPLLEPIAVHARTLLEHEIGPGWVPSQLSDALRAHALPELAEPADARCAAFRASTTILEQRSARFAVALGADSALLGFAGDLLLFEKGRPPLALTSTETGWAASDDAGGVILGEKQGRIFRGRLVDRRLEAELLTTAPSGQTVARLALRRTSNATAGAAAFELATLSREGTLEVFDGRSWRLAHRFPDAPVGQSWEASMVFTAPGELLAAASNSGDLVRVRGADTTFERLPTTGAALAVASVPSLGEVAGTTQGELALRRPGSQGWELLDQADPIRLFIYDIRPFEDGFVYGASFGNFGQYKRSRRAGQEFCGPTRAATDIIRAIVPLGRDLLLFGPLPMGSQITLLERQ